MPSITAAPNHIFKHHIQLFLEMCRHVKRVDLCTGVLEEWLQLLGDTRIFILSDACKGDSELLDFVIYAIACTDFAATLFRPSKTAGRRYWSKSPDA